MGGGGGLGCKVIFVPNPSNVVVELTCGLTRNLGVEAHGQSQEHVDVIRYVDYCQ